MKFVQVEIEYVLNSAKANEFLRNWQLQYPKRKIQNVTMTGADPTLGWYLILTYEIEV